MNQKKRNIGNAREIVASIYNGQTVYDFVYDFPAYLNKGPVKEAGQAGQNISKEKKQKLKRERIRLSIGYIVC